MELSKRVTRKRVRRLKPPFGGKGGFVGKFESTMLSVAPENKNARFDTEIPVHRGFVLA